MTNRREEMLNATADIRAKLNEAQAALRAVEAEEAEGPCSYARLVRLTERRHDLQGRVAYWSQRFDDEVARLTA